METVKQRFADDPGDMDRREVNKLFDRVWDRERSRGNNVGMVTSEIQRAGFHAYIGDARTAKRLLLELKRQSYVVGNLRRRVEEALVVCPH
jgi:hypothetical protein